MFLEMANLGTIPQKIYLFIHETVTGLMFLVALNGDSPYSQILKVISHCVSLRKRNLEANLPSHMKHLLMSDSGRYDQLGAIHRTRERHDSGTFRSDFSFPPLRIAALLSP